MPAVYTFARMNRYISIGLSIAVAPAILLGYGQWIGSADTIEVSTFAVAIALPLCVVLVVAGIAIPASKQVYQSAGIASLRAKVASLRAKNSDRQIIWGTAWVVSLVATLWFLALALTPLGHVLPEDREVASLPVPQEATHKVSLKSPFLQRHLQSPVSESPRKLLTICRVLSATDHPKEARLLEHVVWRKELKGMLRETYAPRGTVESAIREEASEAETFEALQQRVFSSVAAQRVHSTGDELRRFDEFYARDATYIGNSLWTANVNRELRIHLRLEVRNTLAVAVSSVSLAIEHNSLPQSGFSLSCDMEDHAAVDPGASKTVLCWARGPASQMRQLIEVLQDTVGKLSFTIGSLRTSDPQIWVRGGRFQPESDYYEPKRDEVQKVIMSAGCVALDKCEQAREAEIEKSIKEHHSARVLMGYLGFLALTVLLWFALFPWALKHEAHKPANARGSPLLVAATFITAALVILVSAQFAYLTYPNGSGKGSGYLGIGVLLVLIGVDILHLIFLSVFIIYMLFRSRYVTRARVGALLLGVYAAISPIVLFSLA
jgi:hypothetical protein